MMLVIALAAARAVARTRVIIVLGLVVATRVAHRKGAATSAALRRRMADNVAAWRH
jgi:uncharacterized membrane protein YecN with MAPEG domain